VAADEPLSQDDDRLTIGSNGNYLNLVDGLCGQIDEFAIYAGVLSDATIAEHASYSQGDPCYVVAVMASNPLLYFRFEDAASPNGAPVHNSGSVARNGTYIGNPSGSEPNLVAGYIGNAVELYGFIDGNDTCIDVLDDDGAFFPEDGNVTVEFWTRVPDANGHDEWWFEHSNGGTQLGYGLGVHYFEGTDNYYNYIRGGGSTNPIVTYGTGGNQWHHVVVTFESHEVFITPYPEPECPSYDYCCIVKEDDPCLYLRFENGNNPCDDSGNNYWVEYGPNTTIDRVGIGNCIYFGGGAGSYAAAANQQTEPNADDINDVNFGHQYGFTEGDTTWEFWYRGTDVGDMNDFAVFFNQSMRGDETQDINSPVFEMAGRVEDPPGGIPAVYSRYAYNRLGGATSWGYANQNPSMRIPLDNRWHHIVMSWEEMINGNNQMNFRLCIDGISVKGPMTYPDTSPRPGLVGGPGGEMDHIVIGAGGWRDAQADDSTLIGYIDEFAIYGYILPEYRVIEHYEAGLYETCQGLWDGGSVPDWAEEIDRNQDCLISFSDFAEFALEWALCNDPQGGPGCAPNW
jgi:hypothetical protein